MSLRARIALALAAGAVALVLALAASAALGPQPISISAALAGRQPDANIFFGLRLPRALLGAVVGCALAAGGTALQALLRNPLAEPFVLGISGGATLGGTAVVVASALVGHLSGAAGALLGSASPVTLGAIAGAALATLFVFALGRSGGALNPTSVLLAGVIFNAFVYGVTTLLRQVVPPEQAARLEYWLVGALGYESGTTLAVGAGATLAATAVLVALSGRLNLLAAGDEEATSLGVNVGRTRAIVFLAASVATGAAVALAGIVGFVGLIVPHIVRLALGPDHRALVPASALFGAVFLVLADTLARLAFLPLGTEPPVGAVTAFLGGPLFLWLMRRDLRRA